MTIFNPTFTLLRQLQICIHGPNRLERSGSVSIDKVKGVGDTDTALHNTLKKPQKPKKPKQQQKPVRLRLLLFIVTALVSLQPKYSHQFQVSLSRWQIQSIFELLIQIKQLKYILL